MSFAAVVMFAEPGSARLLECVSVSAPAKIRRTSLPSHEFVEAMVVIVVFPVMLNAYPVLGGVMVEAEAIFDPRDTVCRMKA